MQKIGVCLLVQPLLQILVVIGCLVLRVTCFQNAAPFEHKVPGSKVN